MLNFVWVRYACVVWLLEWLDFGCLFEIVLLGLAWGSGCWLCVGVKFVGLDLVV